ncbi:hypothetical protein CC79DRAFT_1331684 [Sarocladium strictum]
MDASSAQEAQLARILRRRVPPSLRKRTPMSCDYCRRKRCKCSRPPDSGVDGPCRACIDHNQECRVTDPRKKKTYYGAFPTPGSESQWVQLSQPRPLPSTVGAINVTRNQAQQNEDNAVADRAGSVGEINNTIRRTEKGQPRRRGMLNAPTHSSIEFLYEDSSGLPQYIGPTGSYTLLVSVREMLSLSHRQVSAHKEAAQTMAKSTPKSSTSPLSRESQKNADPGLPPRHVTDDLVALFFSKVHRDFAVFHQGMFQSSYEKMWSDLERDGEDEGDPALLMSVYMIIVLALEMVPAKGSGHERVTIQERYVEKAEHLLPSVMSGCSLAHVQALMLYCLHLHISRERNACWNIFGAAIRMAVAIGLHRNGRSPTSSSMERELRKRIWWTLFAFECIECSSLGRPSAIHDSECNAVVPAEGFLDMGDIIPIGYLETQVGLLALIRDICKNQYGLHDLSEQHAQFANDILEVLLSFDKNLPSHLRPESVSPKSHLRSVVMLHLQYHYALVLLSRPFLVAKLRPETVPAALAGPMLKKTIEHLSQVGVESAIAGMKLLKELDVQSCFNSMTSWDVYYLESFAMVIALGKMVNDKDGDSVRRDHIVEGIKIGLEVLRACDDFSPTMERFAQVSVRLLEELIQAAPRQQQEPGTEPPRTALNRSPIETPFVAVSAPVALNSDQDQSNFEVSEAVPLQTDQSLEPEFSFLGPSFLDQLPDHWAADMDPSLNPLSGSWEMFGQWIEEQQ